MFGLNKHAPQILDLPITSFGKFGEMEKAAATGVSCDHYLLIGSTGPRKLSASKESDDALICCGNHLLWVENFGDQVDYPGSIMHLLILPTSKTIQVDISLLVKTVIREVGLPKRQDCGSDELPLSFSRMISSF